MCNTVLSPVVRLSDSLVRGYIISCFLQWIKMDKYWGVLKNLWSDTSGKRDIGLLVLSLFSSLFHAHLVSKCGLWTMYVQLKCKELTKYLKSFNLPITPSLERNLDVTITCMKKLLVSLNHPSTAPGVNSHHVATSTIWYRFCYRVPLRS